MSETLAEILDNARPILIRLALVSHAPAGRLDAMPRTHGTPEHRRPPGDAHPPAERYRDRLQAATSPVEARRVLDEARAELERTLRRPLAVERVETAEEFAERIVLDGAGWTADEVALAVHCLPRFVRAARLGYGRDPEDGLTPPDGDPMAVARRLYGEGRSLRTIERLTGLPRSTLHDRLSGGPPESPPE